MAAYTARTAYFYFTDTTPRAANAMDGYRDRAISPEISVAGGLYNSGETLSVELSAPDGGRIYYTLDCSDPTKLHPLYRADHDFLHHDPARGFGEGRFPHVAAGHGKLSI